MRRALIFTATLLLTVATAKAQDSSSLQRWSLRGSTMGGLWSPTRWSDFGSSVGNSHARLYQFGIGGGYSLNERWSINIGLERQRSKKRWADGHRRYYTVMSQVEWESGKLYAGAGLHATWEPVKSRLYHYPMGVVARNWMWGPNVGVGVRMPLTKCFNLRLGVEGYLDFARYYMYGEQGGLPPAERRYDHTKIHPTGLLNVQLEWSPR